MRRSNKARRFVGQVGQNVREARRGRQMTQVELGHRLAADAPTVSRIESGKKDLRTSELFEVARALGCVPADLARLPSADA